MYLLSYILFQMEPYPHDPTMSWDVVMTENVPIEGVHMTN